MLEQQMLNGHTCFPKHDLLKRTTEELLIDNKILETSLSQLLEDRLLHCVEHYDEKKVKQDLIFRMRYYRAEQRVSENIIRILNSQAYTSFESESSLIEEQEKKAGLELDQAQRDAVNAALKHKVLIYTWYDAAKNTCYSTCCAYWPCC
jgi:hypothetical protein